MNTPLSWIKDYVPELDCSVKDYIDRITLTGTKVESVEVLNKNLSNIFVGKILKVDKHPDADKLKVCLIDVGNAKADGVDENGHVQIVTGAANITEASVGALVPAVLDGGKVAGGHDGGPLPENGVKINTGKLRGVVSYGMLCSIEELGSDKNYYPLAPEEGIYIFDENIIKEYDLKPGDDAIAAFGLDDTVVEYEITSNRVDCYSVVGIAREAAATFNKAFHAPVIKETGNSESINDYLKVSVENYELCPRFSARIIKNVHIAPSPEWMQKRLRNSGIRPINNLVDITNFVMLEMGQPMHAYDYDQIAGHEMVIKCASDGDTYRTLDGQERKLDHTVLMVNDKEKPVGIAGIMGGENSMITDSVKTVIFESANWNGTNIRLSSKKIGLRTDASSIFEKGLDPANGIIALNRACELCEELKCGEVVGGMIDIYPNPEKEETLLLQPDKINSLLGTDVSKEEMINIFRKIDIGYDEKTNLIHVPSFRRDLHCQADLAEEVLRFHGYDKIGETLPVGEATTGKLSYKLRIDAELRKTAEACGFSHAMTYAFESPKCFDKLCIPEDSDLRNTVTISNPLGEDFSIMRTQPLNAILTALSFNFNHRNSDVKLYDIANIYLPKALPLTELPDEREQVTLGAFGQDVDFYTMKGTVEQLLSNIGFSGLVEMNADCDRPYFHPGRKADIMYENTCIGYMGEIHPKVSANYDFKANARVYVAVLDVPSLLPFSSFDRKYEGIAKFPAVTRDISMEAAKDIKAGDIEKMIRQRGGKILESVKLFDIYEGEQVRAGFKSMAYSLSFRSKDHTLTDEETVNAMKKILNGLSSLNIELRQ